VIAATAVGINVLLAAIGAWPDAASLRGYHDLLGSEPHVAGTPGDARQIERLATAFDEMGLSVRIEPFWALLAVPIEANLEIVDDANSAGGAAPGAPTGAGAGTPGAADPAAPPKRRGVIPLPIREKNLLEDPATAHPDLAWGWNAYSASGEVEAGVIFANRGTKADFAKLKQDGVDCAGRIVLIRYGGIFRGSKVRNAQDAGAAAVLLYTDPADSGSGKGAVWPEGGWANDLCVQRGSVLTLENPGDPLTPLIPATKDAPRLELSQIDLPRIPVQPIGYAAAAQIMLRMRGAEIPDGDPWRGGMPVPYRVGDGEHPRLRLKVVQERVVRESANVIAVLPGAEEPERSVIVGCHHDAWGFGAADPLAGTIVLMETARTFAALAKQGIRPRRSIIFAAWGAEEFGIIGSVEWVEAHREAIASHAIAYINLDMAAMGPRLGASASPSLRPLVMRRSRVERVGDPGGGSDHVGFLHHLAIPCIGLGAGGSAGDSYHSNYDTLAWYRSVVGEDYASALAVTRACIGMTAELADATILPIRVSPIGRAIAGWVESYRGDGLDSSTSRTLDALRMRGESIAELGARVDSQLDALATTTMAGTAGGADALDALDEGLDELDRARINGLLMALDRAWYDPAGLTQRSWYRNLALASDPDSAYGSKVLPLLAEAVATQDPDARSRAMERTADAIDRIAAILQELELSTDPMNGFR